MPLEREAVVRVALALLDDVGLDGLTVRRLAERLGVQNPALYWHFKNKQDLLDAMARTMIADAFAGIRPPGTNEANEAWTDWLAWLRHRKLSAPDTQRGSVTDTPMKLAFSVGHGWRSRVSLSGRRTLAAS